MSLNINADERDMRRILVGLKLFPAVVAADYLVTDKTDQNKQLQLFILYEHDALLAQQLADNLSQINKIKNIPIKVKASTFKEFLDQKLPARTAAFIAEQANSQLDEIIKQGISSSTLLFSPFKGDVERGVHSGLIVSDRILPHVNTDTLNQSGIKLKSFFLRASQQYEKPATP